MYLFKYLDEPWQITAARFIVNAKNGCTQTQLNTHLESKKYELTPNQVWVFWSEEVIKPAGRQHPRAKVNSPGDNTEDVYQAPLELVQKIADYEELKEARKNAKNAFWFSIMSLIIAFITLAITSLQ